MQTEPPEGNGRVVREIPVYLAPRDCTSDADVYIFNYPLRSPQRPYQLSEQCEAMRLKPNQAKAEIDIGLDIDGENYDPAAESQVVLKKQTLCSMSVPPRANYAVGMLTDDALHLVPVHAIVQMRPSMTYLDSAQKAEASKKVKEERAEEEDGSESMTAVQVQFKRHETDREAERRLNSYAEAKRKEDEEAWVELEVYGETSKAANDLRTQLCQGDPTPLPFGMNHAEYLGNITPCNGTENILGAGAGTGALSRQYLNTLPVDERMRALFAKGQSQGVRYESLKRLAPANTADEDLLYAIEKVANLVQGLWVASSALRYPDDITHRRARDFLLLYFAKNRNLKEDDVLECTKYAPVEVVKEVLKGITVHQPKQQIYEFTWPTDFQFIKQFPKVTQEQEDLWQRTRMMLENEVMEEVTQDGTLKHTSLLPEVLQEQLKEVIPALVKEVRVCGVKKLRIWLRTDKRAGIAAQAADSPEPDLLSVAEACGISVVNATLILPQTGDKNSDPFRELVIQTLKKQPTLNKPELLELARQELNMEISNSVFNRVLKEICVFKEGAWVLRSGND